MAKEAQSVSVIIACVPSWQDSASVDHVRECRSHVDPCRQEGCGGGTKGVSLMRSRAGPSSTHDSPASLQRCIWRSLSHRHKPEPFAWRPSAESVSSCQPQLTRRRVGGRKAESISQRRAEMMSSSYSRGTCGLHFPSFRCLSLILDPVSLSPCCEDSLVSLSLKQVQASRIRRLGEAGGSAAAAHPDARTMSAQQRVPLCFLF